MDRLGVPFDRKKNNLLRGISRMESLEIVLDGRPYSEEEKKAFAEEKNAVYRGYLASLTPEAITDNVRDTLAALKKNGIKIAIGSSNKKRISFWREWACYMSLAPMRMAWISLVANRIRKSSFFRQNASACNLLIAWLLKTRKRALEPRFPADLSPWRFQTRRATKSCLSHRETI